MRRIVATTVFALAITTPGIAGPFLVDSTVSVVNKPSNNGGCSTSCAVGGAGTTASDNGRGGYQKQPPDDLTETGFSQAGTPGTGRITLSGGSLYLCGGTRDLFC